MAIKVLPDECPGCGRPKSSKAKLCAKCNGKLARPPQLNGAGEAEVVMTEDLAVVLNEFKELWYRERDAWISHSFNTDASEVFMGPTEFMAFHSEVSTRRVHGIMKCEYKTVGLSVAERLLQAIDREYLLSNGTIRIVPNPNWSTLRWVNYMSERGCR